MISTARLSKCRKYRYALHRTWDKSKPYAMFIGLNPSTANETQNDPTSIRCINYSKDWGFGGLCLVNLFAFRATEPSVMMSAADPIGNRNDFWIRKLATNAGIIVAAWGNDGVYMGRSQKIVKMIPELMCLRINQSGEPAHPLYQPKSAVPSKLR